MYIDTCRCHTTGYYYSTSDTKLSKMDRIKSPTLILESSVANGNMLQKMNYKDANALV